MLAAIDQHRAEITALCRRHDVRSLDLFGSATGADFDETRSDVDFLVEFGDASPDGAADRYFGLREGLQALLGHPVDLVMRTAMKNPYFMRTAEQASQRLYAA